MESNLKNKYLEFDLNKKRKFIGLIKNYLSKELDKPIGDLKAELFYDFIKSNFGKEYYNKGIKDLKKYLSQKMDDIEIDIDQLFIY